MDRPHTFPDPAFWGPPLGLAARVAAHLAGGARGLHVFAPAFLPLARQTALPVVVAHAGDARDGRRVRLLERALVVALDHERDVVLVKRAATPASEPADLPAPPSLAGARAGADAIPSRGSAEVVPVAFEGFPSLGWLPGAVSLWAVAGDEIAGPLRVTVGEAVAPYDPAVESILTSMQLRVRGEGPSPAEGEGGAPPWYTPHTASPPVPDAVGIALAATPVVARAQGARALVHGAFRLPPAAAASELACVTLVVTGAADPTPRVLRVRAPHRGGVGFFTVDLAALVPLERPGTAASDRPDTALVYAFGHGSAAGPVRLTFADDARLSARDRSLVV